MKTFVVKVMVVSSGYGNCRYWCGCYIVVGFDSGRLTIMVVVVLVVMSA